MAVTAYDLMMVEKTMTNPFSFTQLRLRVVSLLIGVILVGGCSSATVSPQSSQIELATTTTVLNDDELKIWFGSVAEKTELPDIARLTREQSVMKLSEIRYGLRDFVAASRRNADARISGVGADWVAEIEESMSQILEAMATRNSTAIADALGRYFYLRSKDKALLIVGCMGKTESC